MFPDVDAVVHLMLLSEFLPENLAPSTIKESMLYGLISAASMAESYFLNVSLL